MRIRQVQRGRRYRGGGAGDRTMVSKWVPGAEGEGTLLQTPFARAGATPRTPTPRDRVDLSPFVQLNITVAGPQ